MAAWFNGLFKQHSNKRLSRHQRPRLGQSLLAGERLEHRALLSADAAMTHAAMVADTPGNGVPVAIASSAQPPATFITAPPSDQGLPTVHPLYSSGSRPFDPYMTPLGGEPLAASAISNQPLPTAGSTINASGNLPSTMTSDTSTGDIGVDTTMGGYPGPAGVGVYPFPVR